MDNQMLLGGNLDFVDLKKFLLTEYAEIIRQRGRALFEAGHVKHLDITEANEIEALVDSAWSNRTYEVLFFLEFGRVTSSMCDCPYGAGCKHEVAALYFLLEGEDEIVGPVRDTTQEQKLFSRMRHADQLENLPFLPGYNPGQIIDKIRPNLPYWYNRMKGQHQLINDVEISSKLYEPSWGGQTNLIGDVTTLKMSGKTQVKCNSCSKVSKKLCEHQYVALKDLLSSETGRKWMEDKIDFDQLYQRLSHKYGIAVEKIKKAFSLVITGNQISVQSKMEGFTMQMNAERIREVVRSQIRIDTPSLKEVLYEGERVNEYTNAIVWHNWQFGDTSPYFCLIRGKMDKQQTKLATHIKEVEYPKYFNAEQRNVYRLLLECQKAKEGRLSNQVDLGRILAEQLPVLRKLFHYYFVGDTHFGRSDRVLRKKNLIQFRFSEESAELKFRAYSEHEMLIFSTALFVGNQLKDISSIEFHNDHFICDQAGIGYLWKYPRHAQAMAFFKGKKRLLFYPDERPQFFAFLEEMGKKFAIDVDLSFAKNVKIEKAKRKLFLKEIEDYLVFEPILEYRKMRFNALQPKSLRVTRDAVKTYDLSEVVREKFLDDLESLHAAWSKQHADGAYYLQGEEIMKNYWFLQFFERCKELDISVYGRENLNVHKYNPNRAKVTSTIKSGIDWFDVDVDISFGEEEVSTKVWLEAIKNNSKFIKLGDGSMGILPDVWLGRLQRLQKSATYDKNGLHVDKLKFNLVDQLFEGMDIDAEAEAYIADRKQKLESFREGKEYNLPSIVKADLRHYQLEGFNWLKFLQDMEFGGCLADDMGLGKTLQAISILADFHGKKRRPTSLVIVPRTLLFNWATELDKFCPSLSYLVHHGPSRAKDLKELKTFNIIISTYDTITSDIELFRKNTWAYIILDESQAIKNPQSKRYKAMCLLKSTHRLVMTGTPIENGTFDLFAQMTFANPGLLGNMTSFKRDFVKPIEKEGDEGASALLQKMIHPFVLRRTKEQVATDLPEKTESILFCEMEPEQRRQYEELKQEIRNGLLKTVEEKGIAKSKFMILDGLLRLRQMCNSPLLVDASLTGKEATSIKIEMLIEQITSEIGGHNALVFSQFTSMLSLIRERLDERNIAYTYLDGSTRDRQSVVEEFQNSDTHRIFLISLKAGNTGLNLVKADYVYIVDPWWNPAVEAQAIDRTHRIGQDKHIFAYKLICKDTIEEKILELQKKKKKLASDIIHTDTSVMKTLTKKDLIDLFN
ncbi:MAG: DEAD/DEAH box helicase family protein [Saprospiraceae bacterium]|nr:DEAD/DEAH box helicase family protein [Saprospiraceae bacterium]